MRDVTRVPCDVITVSQVIQDFNLRCATSGDAALLTARFLDTTNRQLTWCLDKHNQTNDGASSQLLHQHTSFSHQSDDAWLWAV